MKFLFLFAARSRCVYTTGVTSASTGRSLSLKSSVTFGWGPYSGSMSAPSHPPLDRRRRSATGRLKHTASSVDGMCTQTASNNNRHGSDA